MIRRRGPGAASSSAVAAEAAGSLSSAETPARAPEKQNHSAGLERGAAGRRGRLGRRDRRREGAGEGDQATAGREPRRRAATSVPRLQAGRGGAGGARSPRRAAWGGGAVEVRAGPGRGSRKTGGQTLRHGRGPRRDFGSCNGQNASAEGPPVQSSRPRILYPLYPRFTPSLQTTLWIPTLQSPPLHGLVPCELRDRRVPARKSKRSMRERITYTHSPGNPKQKDLLALLKPAEDQSVFSRC